MFQWMEECEVTLQELKRHFGQVPLLSKPKAGESLQLYLAVTIDAISSMLTKKEENYHLPVQCVIKALLAVETHYPVGEVGSLTCNGFPKAEAIFLGLYYTSTHQLLPQESAAEARRLRKVNKMGYRT